MLSLSLLFGKSVPLLLLAVELLSLKLLSLELLSFQLLSLESSSRFEKRD